MPLVKSKRKNETSTQPSKSSTSRINKTNQHCEVILLRKVFFCLFNANQRSNEARMFLESQTHAYISARKQKYVRVQKSHQRGHTGKRVLQTISDEKF